MVFAGSENGGGADGAAAAAVKSSVRHLVKVARERVRRRRGEPPRLFVVTRRRPDRARRRCRQPRAGRPAWPDPGHRLPKHPHLRATQIDVDDATEVEQLALQLLSGSDEDETAWRDGEWYTARLSLTPLRPEERRHHRRRSASATACVCRSARPVTSSRWNSLPSNGFRPDRVRSRSRSARRTSTSPTSWWPSVATRASRDACPQLGADFAGVVTAVGPGVTQHQVGDRVAGISANGCWSTFVTCDADLAVTLPAELPDDKAAAVPTAHATAWYGLHDLARISARRQGADPLRDRWRGTGRDRDRPGRRCRDLRHRR